MGTEIRKEKVNNHTEVLYTELDQGIVDLDWMRRSKLDLKGTQRLERPGILLVHERLASPGRGLVRSGENETNSHMTRWWTRRKQIVAEIHRMTQLERGWRGVGASAEAWSRPRARSRRGCGIVTRVTVHVTERNTVRCRLVFNG